MPNIQHQLFFLFETETTPGSENVSYIFRTVHQILMIFAQMVEVVAQSDFASVLCARKFPFPSGGIYPPPRDLSIACLFCIETHVIVFFEKLRFTVRKNLSPPILGPFWSKFGPLWVQHISKACLTWDLI